MTWELEKIDHIGGRNEQQDSVATFSAQNDKSHLLVVADGMGGHKGGRFASKIVVKAAKMMWDKSQQGEAVKTPKKFLQGICDLAHYNINELGKQRNLSPHSTCVLLYIHGNNAWWAHVGDSRLYHFRHRKLLRRTSDHSVVQLLVNLGRVKEEEMATHPDQGRLLQGLGGDESPKPDIGQASVRPGDSLVLCSDGFWEHVSPPTMLQRLLRTDVPLRMRVKRLVKDALEAGGIEGDNIGLAVAQLNSKSSLNIWPYIVSGLIIIALLGGWWYYKY